jgi:hypothetical protein
MGGGRLHTDFWIWNATPLPLDDADDTAERGYDFPGPAGGGHLRIVQGRGSPQGYDRKVDPEVEQYHAPEEEPQGRIWSRGGRGPFSSHMHKTQTIDYAVCLGGGRGLLLDDQTVRLYQGDFVVDVGAWHQWHTPPEGSVMAFDMFAAEFVDGPDGVLQGSDPVMVGDASPTLPDGIRPIRRVVIGDVAPGRPALVSDGPSPDNRFDPARPGFAATRLWQTERSPAPLVRESLHLPHNLVPPRGGTLFRALTLPPDRGWAGKVGAGEVAAWFASMGAPGASTWSPGAPHPYMRKTATLDFCLVVSGSAVLVLDSEEVTVERGEVVVIRGNNHAWSNRTGEPCVIAQCMHDAR